jgi:hypothetical protein
VTQISRDDSEHVEALAQVKRQGGVVKLAAFNPFKVFSGTELPCVTVIPAQPGTGTNA